MKNIILQLWEEFDINSGIIPDGCSLHLDMKSRDIYIKSFNEKNNLSENSTVPPVYEKPIGNPVEVEVSDDLFELLNSEGCQRIMQHSLNNLINLGNILLEDDYMS
jgi:hypothetical protein